MPDSSVDWLDIAQTVLLSREMDRLEVEQLTPQGKVNYQFSAGGHETPQAHPVKPPPTAHPGRSVIPIGCPEPI